MVPWLYLWWQLVRTIIEEICLIQRFHTFSLFISVFSLCVSFHFLSLLSLHVSASLSLSLYHAVLYPFFVLQDSRFLESRNMTVSVSCFTSRVEICCSKSKTLCTEQTLPSCRVSHCESFTTSSRVNVRSTSVNKQRLTAQDRRPWEDVMRPPVPVTLEWTWHCTCNRVLYWIRPSALSNQTFNFKNSTCVTVNLSLESPRLLCFPFSNCPVSLHRKSLREEPLAKMAARDCATGTWLVCSDWQDVQILTQDPSVCSCSPFSGVRWQHVWLGSLAFHVSNKPAGIWDFCG